MITINGNGKNPQATAGYTYIDSDRGGGANIQYLIASSTNASPIQITWQAAVPFNDQDTIEIEGHFTNTAANGVWQYTKIDSTHGTLNGSVGNGVGGATGIGLDWSINPLLQVPQDLVDDVDASTVNPAFEGLFDIAPFFYRRMGAYALIDSKVRTDGALFTTFSTTALNSVTWTDLGVTAVAGRRYLHYGDVLDLIFTTSISCTASNAVALTFKLNNTPTPYNELTAFAQDFIPGTSGVIVPVTLRAVFEYGNGGFPDQPYTVTISGISQAATPNIILSGPQMLSIKHYRPNI